MSEIRKLEEDDFSSFTKILTNAYPGFDISSKEDQEDMEKRLKKLQEKDESSNLYGLFRDGELMGGMRILDFTMNMLGKKIPAGGVGLIAVDLIRKKEKVCKEMMEYFVNYCSENDQTIALLYPFRPSFYRKMGFGLGPQMSQYRFDPKALPDWNEKNKIKYLDEDDKEAVADCYTRYFENTHGMIQKSDLELNKIFKGLDNRVVGYREDGEIKGYLVYGFKGAKEDNFILNDLEIKELIYENREAFKQLMSFIRVQADQVNRVILNTQDEDFYHVLEDPMNDTDNVIPSVYHETNTQGAGLMYRVIDVEKLLEKLSEHDFNDSTLKMKLTINDSFMQRNDNSYILHFEGGKLQIDEDGYDVEVTMDMPEFSSMIMGSLDFSKIYNYGLADISDESYLQKVDRVFKSERSPKCITEF